MAESLRQLLCAIGIVSAPEYVERRAGSRSSWVGFPNVCTSGCAFTVRYVVRSGHAPPLVMQRIDREQSAHGDLVPIEEIAWNETRLRGPVLSVAAWYAYAVRTFPQSTYISKMDDDAYLYTPVLESLLRRVQQVAPNPE